MQKLFNVLPAVTNFDRFGFAVIGEMEGKAPLAWERCRYKQKPISPEIPLASTIKPLPNYRGFFVSAVLRRYNSAEVGVTERTKTIQQQQGLWCNSKVAPDALVTRVIYADSGLHRRAVADSG